MGVRRLSGHYSEVVEQQPENGLALAAGPAQALGGVVKDGTGAAAVEAAAWLVIEFVRGEFDRQYKIIGHGNVALLALVQRGFEVADAFFHAAVVAGKVRRIVEGQHAKAGEEFIDGMMVEGGTVVAFEEQRCAVLAEEVFEVRGDLATVEPISDQRCEAITRGKVLHRDDQGAGRAVFGGIAGPGEPGPEPVDVFHGVELRPPKVLHQPTELPPRETRRKPRVEFRRAVRAATPVGQLAQERVKLRPVERHGFLGAGTLPHGQALALALAPAHEAGVRHGLAQLAPGRVTLVFHKVELVQDLADHFGFF